MEVVQHVEPNRAARVLSNFGVNNPAPLRTASRMRQAAARALEAGDAAGCADVAREALCVCLSHGVTMLALRSVDGLDLRALRIRAKLLFLLAYALESKSGPSGFSVASAIAVAHEHVRAEASASSVRAGLEPGLLWFG